MRDFDGNDGLAGLAHVGGGFTHVVAFGILLGDGRAALTGALGHVVDERAGDTLEIQAFIRIERAVLGGHDGVAHIVRQPLARDDLAVLLGV